MNNEPNSTKSAADSRIEAELSAMSRWVGETPGLWERALRAGSPHSGARSSIFTRRIGGPLLLLILLPLIVLPFLLPSLGRARSRVSVAAAPSTPSSQFDAISHHLSESISADEFSKTEGVDARSSRVAAMTPSTNEPGTPLHPSSAAVSDARLVARKASIDLAVTDVRAAFAKAAFFVSEAGDEFVEDSSLTGDGESAQANLTLRVRADRLGQVLVQLRDLGIVVQESTHGEDVTDQAVDLDARIRNEQRVEKELAELLVTRKDSPLRDIMEVRDSLGRVRESIERLTAQRDRLSRLVSLSTILVVIRHESAVRLPDSAKSDGLGAYFVKAISDAWRTATRALADTAAFLVTVLVGGAVWWIAAIIALVAALRWRSRTLAARAYEPAPAWAVARDAAAPAADAPRTGGPAK